MSIESESFKEHHAGFERLEARRQAMTKQRTEAINTSLQGLASQIKREKEAQLNADIDRAKMEAEAEARRKYLEAHPDENPNRAAFKSVLDKAIARGDFKPQG